MTRKSASTIICVSDLVALGETDSVSTAPCKHRRMGRITRTVIHAKYTRSNQRAPVNKIKCVHTNVAKLSAQWLRMSYICEQETKLNSFAATKNERNYTRRWSSFYQTISLSKCLIAPMLIYRCREMRRLNHRQPFTIAVALTAPITIEFHRRKWNVYVFV